MSINDEFKVSEVEESTENKDKKEEKVGIKEEKVEKKKKIDKKKLYSIIFAAFLAVVVIIGAVTIHSAMTYVAGAFVDYSMAPTINKEIFDSEGNLYNYSNFREKDGNVVNYGLIEPKKTYPVFKRFDVVAIRKNDNYYIFDALRVVGLPGEKVKIDYSGNLYINGELVKQPLDEKYLEINWSNYKNQKPEELYYEEVLGEGEYYLLKDNRYYYNNDSRTRGAYDYEDIYGKVVAIQGTCTVKGYQFINCSIPVIRYI